MLQQQQQQQPSIGAGRLAFVMQPRSVTPLGNRAGERALTACFRSCCCSYDTYRTPAHIMPLYVTSGRGDGDFEGNPACCRQTKMLQSHTKYYIRDRSFGARQGLFWSEHDTQF